MHDSSFAFHFREFNFITKKSHDIMSNGVCDVDLILCASVERLVCTKCNN